MLTRNNVLSIAIVALVVVVAGMGYYIYDQKRHENSVELKIGDQGVSIKQN